MFLLPFFPFVGDECTPLLVKRTTGFECVTDDGDEGEGGVGFVVPLTAAEEKSANEIILFLAVEFDCIRQLLGVYGRRWVLRRWRSGIGQGGITVR